MWSGQKKLCWGEDVCYILSFLIYFWHMDFDIERKKRRQKIMAVFGAVLLGLFVLVILWFTPEPTCSDGKKNGGEVGVDCGGFCGPCSEKIAAQDVIVQKTDFVASGKDMYDAVVWIDNPNDKYGARSIKGKFLFFDVSGKQIGEVPVESFLLPNETKYVLKQGVSGMGESVSSVEWKLENVDWVEMQETSGLRLSITDRKYQELASGAGFSQVSGLLTNGSTYDWNDVVISILLVDRSGKLLATHGTSRQTFRSGEKWDFRLIFPERFPGDVYGVDMQVETNIYNNTNFLKANLPGGAFQAR